MRQVPAPHAPLGIVGDGRLARHLLHYFSLLDLPVRTWSRRSSTQAPAEALDGCGAILLLIRDEAIEPFARSWPMLASARLVHCAGGREIPGVFTAHPLMTFGPDLYDLETYRGIPFVLDTNGPSLAELLPGLPNPSYRLAARDRAYYHALCVMAGNFTTLLWRKLFDEFQARLNLPASAASPYLHQTTRNLAANPNAALTGPLARHDAGTIAANLAALEGDAYQAVYQAFVDAYERRS